MLDDSVKACQTSGVLTDLSPMDAILRAVVQFDIHAVRLFVQCSVPIISKSTFAFVLVVFPLYSSYVCLSVGRLSLCRLYVRPMTCWLAPGCRRIWLICCTMRDRSSRILRWKSICYCCLLFFVVVFVPLFPPAVILDCYVFVWMQKSDLWCCSENPPCDIRELYLLQYIVRSPTVFLLQVPCLSTCMSLHMHFAFASGRCW